MPFAPKGLKAEEHPLYHRFGFSAGLSCVTATMNTVWFPLVKYYKTVGDVKLVIVNPHSTAVDKETGAICAPMSIIDKLSLTLRFSMTSLCNTDDIRNISCSWQPFFGAFPEKYDADDDDTSTTVAAIMQLTKDATEEDITPITTNKLPVIGVSDLSHPLSTVNLAEAYNTHLNMSVDATMEDTPFDEDAFQNIVRYGTNKGALKACLGKKRNMRLKYQQSESKTFFVKKFVPRPVRRIVPYSFFGILVHVPLISSLSQGYSSDTSPTANLAHIGVKCIVSYAEWNEEHNNSHTGGE